MLIVCILTESKPHPKSLELSPAVYSTLAGMYIIHVDSQYCSLNKKAPLKVGPIFKLEGSNWGSFSAVQHWPPLSHIKLHTGYSMNTNRVLYYEPKIAVEWVLYSKFHSFIGTLWPGAASTVNPLLRSHMCVRLGGWLRFMRRVVRGKSVLRYQENLLTTFLTEYFSSARL